MKNFFSIVLAIVVHLAFIAILIFSFDWKKPETPALASPNVIQATAVDESKVQAEVKKLKQAEDKRKQEENERQKRLDEEADAAQQRREDEEKKLEEIANKTQQEERNLQRIEEQRKVEEKRKVDIEQKRLVEQKKLEEQRIVEKKKIEKEQRLAEQKKLEEEKLQAKEKKEQALKDKKRKEDEKRKEEEKRIAAAKQEEERKKRQQDDEAAFKEQLAAEESEYKSGVERQLAPLKQRWVSAIQQKVMRNWREPQTMRPGMSCELRVQQIPGGEVVDVTMIGCTTSDAAFQRSIEVAVRKASPLPPPPDNSLFEREIVFTFKPQG